MAADGIYQISTSRFLRFSYSNVINLSKFSVSLSGVEDLFHSRKQKYLSFDYAQEFFLFST